jgi:hypothetical protein
LQQEAVLTFFLFALWFFLRQVLVVVLHVDKPTFRMALCALAFVMIQFVPEMSEAFFWFNGGVAYTLLWSVLLFVVLGLLNLRTLLNAAKDILLSRKKS